MGANACHLFVVNIMSRDAIGMQLYAQTSTTLL